MIYLLVPELSKGPLNVVLGHAVRWVSRLKTPCVDSPPHRRHVGVYVQK